MHQLPIPYCFLFAATGNHESIFVVHGKRLGCVYENFSAQLTRSKRTERSQ